MERYPSHSLPTVGESSEVQRILNQLRLSDPHCDQNLMPYMLARAGNKDPPMNNNIVPDATSSVKTSSKTKSNSDDVQVSSTKTEDPPPPEEQPEPRIFALPIPLAKLPAQPPSYLHAWGKRASLNPARVQAEHKKYKTQLCKKWEKSASCTKGAACDDAHGIKELRREEENTVAMETLARLAAKFTKPSQAAPPPLPRLPLPAAQPAHGASLDVPSSRTPPAPQIPPPPHTPFLGPWNMPPFQGMLYYPSLAPQQPAALTFPTHHGNNHGRVVVSMRHPGSNHASSSSTSFDAHQPSYPPFDNPK